MTGARGNLPISNRERGQFNFGTDSLAAWEGAFLKWKGGSDVEVLATVEQPGVPLGVATASFNGCHCQTPYSGGENYLRCTPPFGQYSYQERLEYAAGPQC